MKLVFAIVHRDDACEVCETLTRRGFSATALDSTGGFLKAANVTVLVGVDEEKVQAVIDAVKESCHRREASLPADGAKPPFGYYPSMPVEVVVGGATIFVVDIERFERV